MSEEIAPLPDDLGNRVEMGEDVSEEVSDFLSALATQAHENSQQGQITDKSYALLSEMAQKLKTASNPYFVAASEYVKSGGCDPLTFNSAQQITERIAILETLIARTRDLKAAHAELGPMVEQAFLSAGFPPAKVKQTVDAWNAEANLVAQLRDHQIQAYTHQYDLLILLKEHYGHWKITDEGFLQFNEESLNQKYSRLIELINASDAAGRRVQKDIRNL